MPYYWHNFDERCSVVNDTTAEYIGNCFCCLNNPVIPELFMQLSMCHEPDFQRLPQSPLQCRMHCCIVQILKDNN
jgi:hypothetical protein